MKKVLLSMLKFILKFLCIIYGAGFLLGSLGGLIMCFTDDVNPLIFDIILTLCCFSIGMLLLYIAFKKLRLTNKNTSQNVIASESNNKNAKQNGYAYTENSLSHEQGQKNLKLTLDSLNEIKQQLDSLQGTGISLKATVVSSPTPNEVLRDMQKNYSPMQAQSDTRILNDCIKLIQSTNNIETFFSRYELAMEKILTLEQAKQAGININTPITPDYIISLKSRADYVLQATYNKELEEINVLKTAKGKRNRIDKFSIFLSRYQDEFEFSNVYKNIIDKLHSYKKEL